MEQIFEQERVAETGTLRRIGEEQSALVAQMELGEREQRMRDEQWARDDEAKMTRQRGVEEMVDEKHRLRAQRKERKKARAARSDWRERVDGEETMVCEGYQTDAPMVHGSLSDEEELGRKTQAPQPGGPLDARAANEDAAPTSVQENEPEGSTNGIDHQGQGNENGADFDTDDELSSPGQPSQLLRSNQTATFSTTVTPPRLQTHRRKSRKPP